MKKYNIGLDIGTSSVGWAVVNDETNEIIRKGDKKLWGSRLFEPAVDASKRRISRGIRRRFDRRRKRIKLLREEFKTEIEKVDKNFFKKLNESFYNNEDLLNKTVKLSKEEFKDLKEYNNKYKTIYHLRNELYNTNEQTDIRLVYLAIHHIIKYRGNFLFNFKNFNIEELNVKEKFENMFIDISNMCSEIEFNEGNIEEIDYKVLEEVLLIKNKNDRKKEINDIFKNIFSKDVVKELSKALAGSNFSILKLFNIENDEDVLLSFSGSDYEDKYAEAENVLNEKIEVLESLKEIYDIIFLKNLFKDDNIKNISALKISKYNKHKEDLKFLKDVLRTNRKIYNEMFKSTGKKMCTYELYLHNSLDYNEFKNKVIKDLDKCMEGDVEQNLIDKYTTEIQFRLENEEFLPKTNDKENGIYPYQLNKDELTKIIEKQGKFYPFLLEKVNGEYKINKLLEFRIPYYVGPLNTSTKNKDLKNPNAWIIRKNDEIITPYNFDDVVDLEASAEEFITRMISHCTYLPNELAIASNSILYSEFKVRNELKQIKVNERRIPWDLQNKIYDNLFLKTSGKIKEEKFVNYLRSLPDYSMYEDLKVTGYSDKNKFANSMQSYVDFFGEDGIFKDTNYTIEDAEQIIKWITIFEDKKILKRKILNGDFKLLTEKNINCILTKRYKGWSNLSDTLLNTKHYEDKNTKEKLSIMDLMRSTPDNLMQIISEKKYDFNTMISNINNIDPNKKINYSLVENLATSPSTKRGIYQSLKIVEEIIEYLGTEPEIISIEMVRGEEEKKRTDSKKEYISKIYLDFKEEINNYNLLSKQLNAQEKIDSQKLFLYFIQEGKSLYSRATLNIENLNEYEIDHILPRTLIKDDSIENKALVLRNENQEKAANFVLPLNYRSESQKRWWEHLKKLGLMTAKKYNNLCRSSYSNDDIVGFINRQLVETRQITKHVADILGKYHEKTKIVYLHANLSHNLREKYEFFKFREINDFHHAQDAYLAAVLGVFKERYLKAVDFAKLKEINKKLIENKKYNHLKYGYVINSIDEEMPVFNENGEIILDTKNFIDTIKKTMKHNDILISRKTEIRTGEFYEQTKNSKGKAGVSLKDNMPTTEYGSYTSIKSSYACLVKYSKKKKENQKLIGIPIYIVEHSKKDGEVKNNYIRNLLELSPNDNIEILVDKIPFFSLLNWNGQICYLVGATNKVEVSNAIPFFYDYEHYNKWKYSLNRLFNKKKNKNLTDETYESDLKDIILYIIEKIETKYLLYNNLIPELREVLSTEIINEKSLEDKEKIAKEITKLLNIKSECANLKFVNGKTSESFGRKNGRTISNFVVIDKSVTGIRESKREF
ncbi:MAG: type II CRISPR RNA-guided endonuclease Cas9 [Bacilli bacterium]